MLTYRHFISNHQYILKAFTGMIKDSAGRKRYYVNGKPVKHQTDEAGKDTIHHDDVADLTPDQRAKLQQKIQAYLEKHSDDAKPRPKVGSQEREQSRQQEFAALDKKQNEEDVEIESKRSQEDKEHGAKVSKHAKLKKDREAARKVEDREIPKRRAAEDKERTQSRKAEDKTIEQSRKTEDKEIEKKRAAEDKELEKAESDIKKDYGKKYAVIKSTVSKLDAIQGQLDAIGDPDDPKYVAVRKKAEKIVADAGLKELSEGTNREGNWDDLESGDPGVEWKGELELLQEELQSNEEEEIDGLYEGLHDRRWAEDGALLEKRGAEDDALEEKRDQEDSDIESARTKEDEEREATREKEDDDHDEIEAQHEEELQDRLADRKAEDEELNANWDKEQQELQDRHDAEDEVDDEDESEGSFKAFARKYNLKAFTGMITDSAGRKRYYVNGKPVKHETYVGAGHKEHAHTHEQSIRTAVGALSGRASRGTSHADLTQLAEHLNNIPGADLKKLRAKYGVSAEKNPNKEKLVSALLDHVRGGGPAVDVRKFKEQFGIAPPKEAMDSKAGRAKVNDLLARAKKGEDVLDEVKKLKDYDAGLDFGMDAMDEGKVGPTKRESDPETKQDKVTAEAEARNRWDKGQRTEDEAKGKEDPRSLASVGSLEQAKIEDQKKQEEKRKEPWRNDAGEIDKENLPAILNDVTDEIVKHNPKLSPNRAKELAMARIINAIHAKIEDIDNRLPPRGEITPQEESFYDSIHVDKWSPTRQLEELSGSRSSLADSDDPIAKKPLNEVLPDNTTARQDEAAANKAKASEVAVSLEAKKQQRLQKSREHDEREAAAKKERQRQDKAHEWYARNGAYLGVGRHDSIESITARKKRAVEAALAAGKPVPAEVLADYPDLAGKAASAQPPEPGFTGRAANGVYFINGVAQKQQDQPTAGMPRPSAESGLGSGSMQRLAAENKPAAAPEAAKEDAIGKYLSHIDPEQVKQLQARHANVIDTLTSELKKAQAAEDDMLKQYSAADKSKKSSLGRKFNEAKEAANEALNKLADYKYETVDNRKAAIAIDPNQPDFVRLAAGMKPNDDEAANKVIELANQWVKEKGEDPRLGDLIASQALERPLSAGEELSKLLQGEKNRLATMDARKEAAKYVAGLDLLPGQKAEAEQEAAKLYNGDQDRFRQKWDAIQESSKADREKEKQAKAKRDKQQEEQAKTEAGIKSYLDAVDAGKPVGDASQDVLRGAAEHVLRSPEQWHSNFELPKGMNAKQAVDAALKEDTTNAVGKTLLDAGWLTDRRYAVKATPAMKQHAEKSRSAIEAIGGKPLPITDILPKNAGDPAEVVAARNEPTNGLSQILLKSEFNKKDVAIDPRYYAAINAAYPDAKWSIIPQRRQAIATSNGEIVGLVMGMSDHDENGPASTSSIGKRRNFSDHFEPNPLGEGSIEESQRGLMIGHGTPNVAGVEIKKDGKQYIVRAPGIGKVVAPGLREAKAKAKEILLHAHGTDEQGNLVLKPKGGSPPSQSNPSPDQPPEPGFTGRAANGVYYINGVAQKAPGESTGSPVDSNQNPDSDVASEQKIASDLNAMLSQFRGGGFPSDKVYAELDKLKALSAQQLLSVAKAVNADATLTNKTPKAKILKQITEMVLRVWKTSDNVNH